MIKKSNEFNPIILNIIPLGYYYYTRLKFYCNRFPCHLLVLLWETSLFLIPTVWFYYSSYGFKYVGLLEIIMITLLLYIIYEIGYLVNDTITEKRDTAPRNRPATKVLNKKVFALTRIIMIAALYSTMSIIWHCDP